VTGPLKAGIFNQQRHSLLDYGRMNNDATMECVMPHKVTSWSDGVRETRKHAQQR
jgi:hypothetical protein